MVIGICLGFILGFGAAFAWDKLLIHKIAQHQQSREDARDEIIKISVDSTYVQLLQSKLDANIAASNKLSDTCDDIVARWDNQ